MQKFVYGHIILHKCPDMKMQGNRRLWSIRVLPLSFWSAENTAWADISLPVALHPGQELYLDVGQVLYGLAELHFSCEEICHVHMCVAETLWALQDEQTEEHEYKGQGKYPLMLGQQVLRFIRLKVHKPCFLMNLSLWSRADPLFPACPVSNERMEGMWLNACSVVSFCWQEGLWLVPSLRAAADVYSVWVLGPAVFLLAGVVQDWKDNLKNLLAQYDRKEWLEDSPMASLWFFLCLGEYHQHTKDDDFFAQHGPRIKAKLDALLHNCRNNGRIQCPSESDESLWGRIFASDSEEILMAQQTTLFWVLGVIKHLVFHLGWMEQFVKIERFLAMREEFWLFPQTQSGAALAVLGDLPDRRYFFLPQMNQNHDNLSAIEMALLALALAKKNEIQAGRDILQEYWLGKSALYPPAAENPYRPIKDAYILSAWDAMPINLIPILYTQH